MTCASCEKRREWMKKQYDNSKERMRLCIERLTGAADPKQSIVSKRSSRAKSSNSRAKQSDGADSGSEQSIDG